MKTTTIDKSIGEVDTICSNTLNAVENNPLEEATAGLKGSKDSHVNPQPSEDVIIHSSGLEAKEILILLTISATAFFVDYGSGTGAVTLVPQAK